MASKVLAHYYISIPVLNPEDRDRSPDFTNRRRAFELLVRFFCKRCDEFVLYFDRYDNRAEREAAAFRRFATMVNNAAQIGVGMTEFRGAATSAFLDTLLSAPPGGHSPKASPIRELLLLSHAQTRFYCGDYDYLAVHVTQDELSDIDRLLRAYGLTAAFEKATVER